MSTCLSILISVSFRFVFLFSLPVSLLFRTLALAYYDNRIAYKSRYSLLLARQCKDYVTTYAGLAGHHPTKRHSPSFPPRGERGKAKVTYRTLWLTYTIYCMAIRELLH
ncbi:hypothetical protein EDB84DRAFT_615446 [Lactarius hengduanensis]|nr:hypothetical protein EDB84DRAFT_615446 [Lactarius hengduanensis]